jgi:hypothetical protein
VSLPILAQKSNHQCAITAIIGGGYSTGKGIALI